MPLTSPFAFGVAGLAYALATATRLRHRLAGADDSQPRWGLWILALGLLLHAFGVANLLGTTGDTPPWARLQAVAALASLVLAAACLGLELWQRERFVSLFALPLAVALLLFGFISRNPATLPNDIGGLWFGTHVLMSVAGECFFLLAAVVSVAYLFQTRRLKAKNRLRAIGFFPPLARLDHLNAVFTLVGFGLFSAGLLLGAVGSQQVYGIYWHLEPKQNLALATWTVFALAVGGRAAFSWGGPRTAVLAIVGFILSLMLALVSSGWHQFVH